MEILLVDDSESDAMILEEAIEETGWPAHIHNAWNGVEAIDYLQHVPPKGDEHRPDLVILDLNMPKMDGFQVLDTLRADPELADLPIMVLTTSHAEGDIMAAFEHGADSYITKPTGYSDVGNVAHEMQVFWFHHGTQVPA